MAPRKTTKFPNLMCNGGLGHKSLNISKPETDSTNLYSGNCFPDGNRTKRTRSLVLEEGNYSSMLSSSISSEEEDLELKSDASRPELNIVADDEQCIDGLWSQEGARKKLRILARMVGVGVDTEEPGLVLAEVVTVLKGLQGRYDRMSRCLP